MTEETEQEDGGDSHSVAPVVLPGTKSLKKKESGELETQEREVERALCGRGGARATWRRACAR